MERYGGGVGDPSWGHRLVRERTVLRAVVGSRAQGLATEASDTDLRGVYLPVTSDFWGLTRPPAQVEGPGPEQFSWELERCCVLALAGNPAVTEFLYSPLLEALTPVGAELRDLRGAFLSRRVSAGLVGMADRQYAKALALRSRGGPVRWKPVVHVLRSLACGLRLLRTGRLELDVGPDRAGLLSVGRGELSWEQVECWRARLLVEIAAAEARTPLPAQPDTAVVQDFLVRARRGAVPDTDQQSTTNGGRADEPEN